MKLTVSSYLIIRNSIREEFNCAIEKLKQEFTQIIDFLVAEQGNTKISNDKIFFLETEYTKIRKELLAIGGRLRSLEKTSRSCN